MGMLYSREEQVKLTVFQNWKHVFVFEQKKDRGLDANTLDAAGRVK